MYYKCHKINSNHRKSYIDSYHWIKSKKATTFLINKKDKCFQYALTAAQSHEEIKKKDLQRTTKIKPLLNKYNWEGISFSLEKWLEKIWEK